jgi:hypothetical protein
MMEWSQSSEELTMNEMKLVDVSRRWGIGRACRGVLVEGIMIGGIIEGGVTPASYDDS